MTFWAAGPTRTSLRPMARSAGSCAPASASPICSIPNPWSPSAGPTRRAPIWRWPRRNAARLRDERLRSTPDRDLSRRVPGPRRLGNADDEDALVEACIDALRRHREGQREGALEGAEAALRADVIARIVLRFGLLLARDLDGAVRHRDVRVPWLDPGQLEPDGGLPLAVMQLGVGDEAEASALRR